MVPCFDNKHNRWIGLVSFKKLLLYRTIASKVNEARMQQFRSSLTFFFSAFSFADSQDSMGNMKMDVNYLKLVFHIEVKTKYKYKILNFVFQFVKNTKWHFGYTDSRPFWFVRIKSVQVGFID